MAAQNSSTPENYVNSVLDKRVLCEYAYGVVSRCVRLLWLFLCGFLLYSFWFTLKCLESAYRLKNNIKVRRKDGNFDAHHSHQDGQLVPRIFPELGSDTSSEKQSSVFSFCLLRREFENSGGNLSYRSNASRYQFVSGKDVCGFMEEPETMGFFVQEIFVGSTDDSETNSPNVDESFSELGSYQSGCNNEFHQQPGILKHPGHAGPKAHLVREDGNSAEDNLGETLEVKREESSVEKRNCNFEEEMSGRRNFVLEKDDISYKLQFIPRKGIPDLDLKQEERNSIGKFLASFEEISRENLSAEVGKDPMIPDKENPEIIERNSDAGDFNIAANVYDCSTQNFDDEEEEEEGYIEMEPYSLDSIHTNEDFNKLKCDGGKERQPMDEGDESSEGENVSIEKESKLKSEWESNLNSDDEFDILVEHQKLVKQMKMEVKNSKVKGLPTICEEGECAIPKGVEDLKPLKLEEKWEYKDRLREIRKLHKSYAEKMRKLDILNFQSLQAISFLQLKDSQLLMQSKKASIAFKYFPLPSFRLCKERRVYADPTLKSINELHRDLELVYVGQVCLSWEILQWQYWKAIQLLEYDSQDHHSYNQVACECQQFQVLLQRFVEDEPFRGPRIQNYVKSRHFCRGLLLVPMFTDDHKEKKGKLKEKEDSISVGMLVEIVKESMQVFWEFVRADKDENAATSKSLQGHLAHLQSLDDSELLTNIRASLEKKQRKLKAIYRSGNCVVKKFQKLLAERPTSAMVMAQVELKLVSRVLSLSRLTTDQVIWCQRKLNSINIVDRKLDIEPGFSLFPC